MNIKTAQNKTLLPAIAAAGGVLAALPAGAVQLGDIEVHSRLGQPLRASIAFALGPNEQLYDFCVSLSQGRVDSGLPAVRRASVNVANGVISLTGRTPIREPMLSARVIVDCPYSAHISREYMLFIDPPGTPVQEIAAGEPVAAPVQQQAQPVQRSSAPAPRTPVVRSPIANATRYRVQPGDSLSAIAQRIEERPVGLWDAVNQIFATNPAAFMNNDMNQLKAGSWLLIPDFGADAPMTVADDESQLSAEPAAETVASADFAAPVVVEVAAEEVVAEEVVAEEPVAELQPGDIILDTQLEAQENTAQSPNAPEARIVMPTLPAEPKSSYSWLLWLGGTGIAIIVGLLMFGRRGRETFGSTPVGPAVDHTLRHGSDSDTQNLDAYAIANAAEETVIDDESPTEENLALDADLVIGTGLQKGADVEVAEDFAFAATTVLDLELPEEMSSNAKQPETDMIPPLRINEESILDSEILPDDDDYDMSVIIDATKMPQPEDVTERDLKAVVVNVSEDDTLIEDNYTVSKEVDYKILEQDYEEELTTTEALNQEIAKAAAELAKTIDEVGPEDVTAEMPMATVTELDITAQLPAQNDDINDLDDTGINEEITVEIEAEDKTVEMPAADDDDTMEIESGKVDTKPG